MEFVDYKCLETLLNEGEEIIVTEGIVSAIRGIIGRVFGMFKNFIDMIWNHYIKEFLIKTK